MVIARETSTIRLGTGILLPAQREPIVTAKAVATLYRNHISGGAIALLALTMLIAVIVALWVSRTDGVVLHWATDYWNHFTLWIQHLVT